MRLLIVTQAVDLDDPVLGFFHRWIAEFAKHCEHLHVICLKEGRHDLPANVSVYSLGKEKGRSRIKYVFNFYRYIWRSRRQYDAVFVHMNSEYVVLGAMLWRAWGKRIVLWRNHKKAGLATWLAAKLSDVVCYTSPEAYVARFSNSVQMPIGIDTDFFSPGSDVPKPNSILFLGRLDPVKRVEVFVDALKVLHERGVDFKADIVGDPTDPNSKYVRSIREQAAPLVAAGVLQLHPGVTNEEARDLFRSRAIYVNLTPSGSFDKTIGEAMACGAIVVCANDAVKSVMPPDLLVLGTAKVAVALQTARSLPAIDRTAISTTNRSYIERGHSLSLLVDSVLGILRT